ncbi:MAG: sulfotransferase [Proteobacteria bacterium]|nr:sulfotransferase [Pseudomonadota bacterium]
MRTLFVGGPGRSGTSFVAERLGRHGQVVMLKDIELKIFCEKNGLQDLFHALVETYSPNRAVMALSQFQRMAEALIVGGYGQPALTTAAPADDWRACFGTFSDGLLAEGHPAPQTAEHFFEAARALLHRIAALAAGEHSSENTFFLEKTPHNLLAIDFLARLAPGARFLHVMRDPRSIAWSLLAARWGPDRLATASRWVDSYCRAWAVAEARAAGLGLALTRLHIEAAAAAPAATGAWLTARLGLAPRDNLFEDADPTVLNRWAAQAEPAERALLDARLGGWAAHFGYDPEQIGRRPGRATPHATRPDQEHAPEPATPS